MGSMWWRRLLLGLGGLVVLLVAAVLWWAAQFDANRYKSLATDWMMREHQRTLVIAGPVELSLLPRLQVKLSRLRLSEQGRSDEFAALDQAALAVELLPLLAGRLVVDRVAAQGLRLVYTRDAQGLSNIDDLLLQDAPAKGKNETASKPFALDISRVELEDLRATVRDDMTPLHGDITLTALRLTGSRAGQTADLTLQATLALRQPAVAGELTGEARVSFEPGSGALRLDAKPLRFTGAALAAQAVQAQLQGQLSYDGATKTLHAQALKLDLDATLGALKLAASQLTLERLALEPANKTLLLSGLQFKLAGQRSGDAFALTLDWPQLEAGADTLKASALAGKLSLAGATALEATLQSGAASGSFEQIRLPQLALALKGRRGVHAIDGTLKSDLRLRLAKEVAVDFNALDLSAQLSAPGQPTLALHGRGQASASAKQATWKLAGSLSSNAFASDGKLLLGGARPALQAQARFDSLDLNQLLAPPTAPAKPASAPADVPVNLSALRAVDGRFALSAGRLALRQYRVGEARLEASLASGMLRVSKLQGQAWGGSLAASGWADASGNRVGLTLTGSGVDANALLRDVASFDRLEGRGRVDAQLESAGASVGALRRALRGSAALQLRDGAIKGINLAQSLRQAKAALSLKQDSVQRASQTEKTDFSELSASFKIEAGVARSSDLDLKSPFLRLGGAGAIDIGQGRIDYTARATVAPTSKGQGGAELEALKGLTVPVRLSGPLDAVDWQIQWSAVAAAALTQQVQNKLRQQLDERLGLKAPAGAASGPPAKPRDLLKERLKGLLR